MNWSPGADLPRRRLMPCWREFRGLPAWRSIRRANILKSKPGTKKESPEHRLRLSDKAASDAGHKSFPSQAESLPLLRLLRRVFAQKEESISPSYCLTN